MTILLTNVDHLAFVNIKPRANLHVCLEKKIQIIYLKNYFKKDILWVPLTRKKEWDFLPFLVNFVLFLDAIASLDLGYESY